MSATILSVVLKYYDPANQQAIIHSLKETFGFSKFFTYPEEGMISDFLELDPVKHPITEAKDIEKLAMHVYDTAWEANDGNVGLIVEIEPPAAVGTYQEYRLGF